MGDRPLDLICLGRGAVDLYAEQLGARLEDVASFAKYIGGCAANIAVGTARQGLKSSMLLRVGDDHMGRFVRETLAREGVETGHVSTDPSRLTALVLLGIKDRDTFPLIFYRENCADMALAEGDFDAGFIGSAKALLVTGTHFLDREHQQGQPPRDRPRQADRHQGDLRHRLSAGALGPDQPQHGRDPLHRLVGGSRRICKRSCRIATSSSAPRKNTASPADPMTS